ncbi:MAG: VOC family protein, partial [Candidatus Eremiobacteraeota bacterium]|nr:VOC family protein [Candidatus Eremiobacteraeota bacterium]
MRTHMSFATKDLDASVAFYRTLLGVEPAKQYKDYALFLIDDPGLELALSRDADA